MKTAPIIAIASGKGGTGKTTVAVHLATWLAEQGRAVQYLDCDVEEPNGHLFLRPTITSREPWGVPQPVIDNDRCTSCGKCAEVCVFNAIAMLKKPLVFPELCHGCGGCTLACPVAAIREEPHTIGEISLGAAGDIAFGQGRLNIGEPLAPPLIRALIHRRQKNVITLLDAPPGASCPAVTVARDADCLLLVTEPTPFGLHDLTLAIETFRPLGHPMGVVLNRADNDTRIQDFCAREAIPLLAEIPDDRRVAETYARGNLLFETFPEWRNYFTTLWTGIEARR